MPNHTIAACEVADPHLQVVHRNFGFADCNQEPVLVRESPAPHAVFEPIEITQHRPELVLKCAGLIGRQIVALHLE
jgi:hypothetical protein